VRFGTLKKNHFFRIFLDKNGIPRYQVARFIRSEKWLQASVASDLFSGLLFSRLPSVDKHPVAVRVNLEKLDQLDKVVAKSSTFLSDQALTDIRLGKGKLIDYVPEPFLLLLERIKANASVAIVEVQPLSDPENQKLDKFMEESRSEIRKLWSTNETKDSVKERPKKRQKVVGVSSQ